MKTVIALFFLITVVLANNITKRDIEAVAPIADGGTNSGTALVGNKAMCSLSGAIVECPGLVTNGNNFYVVAAGISNAKQSPVMVNLVGTNSAFSTGPHINTYTSADNYPLMQVLSYTHDNQGICFDCYWDGFSWKSSYSGSNYVIYKAGNQLSFSYNSGVSQGSTTSFSSAILINTSGITTINSLVSPTANLGTVNTNTLSTGAITASSIAFNHVYYGTSDDITGYWEDTYSLATTGAFSGTAVIDAVRIGRAVMLTFHPLTGTASGGGAYTLEINATSMDSKYWPTPLSVTSTYHSWVIMVVDSTSAIGRIRWWSGGDCILDLCTYWQKFQIFASYNAGFSNGSGRGYTDRFSISYQV